MGIVPVEKTVGNVPKAWFLVRGLDVVENGGLFSADFDTSALSTIAVYRVSMLSEREKSVAVIRRAKHVHVNCALLLPT
jgi:hypothetical protein